MLTIGSAHLDIRPLTTPPREENDNKSKFFQKSEVIDFKENLKNKGKSKQEIRRSRLEDIKFRINELKTMVEEHNSTILDQIASSNLSLLKTIEQKKASEASLKATKAKLEAAESSAKAAEAELKAANKSVEESNERTNKILGQLERLLKS